MTVESEPEMMDVDAEDVPRPNASKADKGKGKSEEPAEKALDENLPWVEKYRPSNLSDLISHQDIIATITKLISENKLPHLLFYGPPGTGKTSTILAVAKKLYGPRWQSMVLELNASDDRGIDVVRDQIKSFASTRNIFSSGFKLIILDEADALTNAAQFSLRRIIEKYTRNTRFCLICNYVSKIMPALQSRCTRFRFAPLAPDQVRNRLNYIIAREQVPVTDDGLESLIKLGGGDMRRSLNILQSCFMASGTVTEESVYLCTGNPLPSDIEAIVNLLLNETYKLAFQQILELKTVKGLALVDILRDMQVLLRQIQLPPQVRIRLVQDMADIEYRLAFGTSEKLQLASLVGAFSIVQEMVGAEAERST